MGEVEKKNSLSWKQKIAIGTIMTAVVMYGGFSLYSTYQKAKVATKKALNSANPASVPPQTVAKAISGGQEKNPPPPPSVPAPPTPKPKPKPEKKEKKKEKPAESGWKLPKPPGNLMKLPKENFTAGLPKPSGLFPRLKKKTVVAERMRVVTPRLVVRSAPKPVRMQERTAVQQKKAQQSYAEVIAAGMFVPATLSQGIMAPIGYKVPVRFKLTGRAVGVGDYSFDLSSCVVLAAGKGVETGNAARIEVQLIKLSCQWPDGKVHTVPVNGYVVDGKDGKVHLSAKLEENDSKVVLASFLQGAVAGAAEAAQKAQEVTQTTAINSNTSITSQEIKNPNAYAFWGGVASALSQTQQILQKKIAKLLQVEAADREPGGKVYLVFTQGVKVPESWLKGAEKNTYDYAGYEQW